jgi:Leucine-rich repeat (LRR) protein
LNGLSINFCNLPILKSGLFKSAFKGIEYVDLQANYVETIEPSAFQYLIKLKWLNLNKNGIQALTTRLFKNNPDLTVINLRNNQISSTHLNFFGGLSKLNFISFGKNNFCVKDDVGCQTCEVVEAKLNGKLKACFRGCKTGTDCYSSFFDQDNF